MQDKPVTVWSGAMWGVDALPVTIEVALRGASGSPRILGLVDTVVREAYHRILVAFRAVGLPTPRGTPTFNFVPAGVRKSGSGFDLPMALALAGAAGQFPLARVRGLAVLGEVSLEGRILPVRGAVSVALSARDCGVRRLLTSPAGARAAALVPGMEAYGVAGLREAVLWLRGELRLPPAGADPPPREAEIADLCDIRGHRTPKAALLVAAAGRHNALLVGPPGSGKTALARRLPGIMPPTSQREVLEILKVHTASGADARSLRRERPFRAPHHSSSHVSLLGGGPDPRPGETTLAQHGVLFLDELPEFRREALEGLRQPLEDGVISIGRALRTVTMPADFLLVAAMNPCPCGYLGHPSRPCVCTPGQRRRYRARISGPLLDRLDLQVEVPALDPRCFREPPDADGSTAALRGRVLAAIERQAARNRVGSGWVPNGRLSDRLLERVVGAGPAVLQTLEDLLRAHHLSGRARVRLLRIARTLADLDDRDRPARADLLTAARLRGGERLLGDGWV